jgi:hypothetical protein
MMARPDAAPIPRANPRAEAKQARLQLIRQANTIARARVVPKNDDIRRVLKHPTGWIGFRATGSVEWPLDNFTARRLRDGDVTLEDARQEDKQPD